MSYVHMSQMKHTLEYPIAEWRKVNFWFPCVYAATTGYVELALQMCFEIREMAESSNRWECSYFKDKLNIILINE